jgi:molybdenum cofactor synthesis domain-containing protein
VTGRATAGLCIIGDEVLSASVRDVNTPFLLDALRELGAQVREVVQVADDRDAIVEAVTRLTARCDFVITTGGIGPTHDDVTVAAVAEAFGVAVIEHPEILAVLESHAPLTPGRRRLARVPEGAVPVWSQSLRWPVARMRNVWLFPGVPDMVRGLFQDLRPQLPTSPQRARAALELAVEESVICEALDALAATTPDVAIGSYPRPERGPDGRVAWRVRLTFEGADSEAVSATHAEARALFGRWELQEQEVEPR